MVALPYPADRGSPPPLGHGRVSTYAQAPYDYHRLLYTFRVKSRLKDTGIYRPKHSWRFSGDIRFKPPV